MLFEALAAQPANTGNTQNPLTPIELPLSVIKGIHIVDWAPLIPMLLNATQPLVKRALCFHESIAHTLLEKARQIREKTGVNVVGLAGGVFQNRVLTEKSIALLENNGFEVTLPLLTPVNDGGISFGQVIEYGYNSSSVV